MTTNRHLPPEFLRRIETLETFYLQETDPILQSGSSGGALQSSSSRCGVIERRT